MVGATSRGARRLTRASSAALLVAAVAGCRETPRPDASAAAATSAPRAASPPAPSPEIAVADVKADPGLDADQVRSALEGATAALSACLEPGGSTGVVVLRFPIERDGAVGDVAELGRSTYGGDEARACMGRIVESMRFPPSRTRGEVEVVVEVRSRHL